MGLLSVFVLALIHLSGLRLFGCWLRRRLVLWNQELRLRGLRRQLKRIGSVNRELHSRLEDSACVGLILRFGLLSALLCKLRHHLLHLPSYGPTLQVVALFELLKHFLAVLGGGRKQVLLFLRFQLLRRLDLLELVD